VTLDLRSDITKRRSWLEHFFIFYFQGLIGCIFVTSLKTLLCNQLDLNKRIYLIFCDGVYYYYYMYISPMTMATATRRMGFAPHPPTSQSLLLICYLVIWLGAPVQAFVVVPNHVSSFAVGDTSTKSTVLCAADTTNTDTAVKEETVDVIVIGAGVGGLSCAALTAKYGLETLCLEAHDTAGGCAHSFARYNPKASKTVPFRFDSGPSLCNGLSAKGDNPLRQVLDAVGTADEIEWKIYDGWIVHDTADGTAFKLTTGDSGAWEQALEDKAGPDSRKAFEKFKKEMLGKKGLSIASGHIPPFAIRGGLSAVGSLAKYTFKLLSIGSKGALLTGPFSKIMDLHEMNDVFVRKWFDYLSFALSGVGAAHTQAAPVAFMMKELHKKDAVLDYPMGGMGAIVQALISGMEKHGGELRVNSRVERMLLEDGKRGAECKGVVLADGTVIRARKGVVCNAPLWNMARLLEDSVPENAGAVVTAVQEVRARADDMSMTGSFMHLHLGIPKDGLPDDLECHHSVLDFSKPVTDEQNMVIISIPTVFDPSLAPEGYHIVHAYTAASDSFDDWSKFLNNGVDSGKVGHSPNSGTAASYGKLDGYDKLKADKSEALWRAIECVIPDVRKRAKNPKSVVLNGTPLTHRRYNQRFRGTYGPAPAPGKDVWELPMPNTKIKGLLTCGDTTFPGIGLPGVAASGTIAANTLTTVKAQNALMKELKSKGALQ
jgi:phytoene dehydrogenase-like protein